ncbi:hypothetical protein SASPL_126202 [Salvia splendens]|uniref:Uncharacterized protein n=1 Tax=Salvia splendens TaxID=180675 RepID=A0A8X8ZRF6_SALSN|nr:hypothetical protein SASPL_126202 [Salvia splendens]
MFTIFLNKNQNQMANPKVFFDMTIDSDHAALIVIKLQKTCSQHFSTETKIKWQGVLRHDHRQRPSRPDLDQIAKV